MIIAARRFAFAGVLLAVFASGCVSVARVASLDDPACREAFATSLSAILVEQGEAPDVAAALAGRATATSALFDMGPRPFLVASSSGTDYSFFVEAKPAGCLLRLYQRQKGFRSYTNDITYIATRPIAACECVE
jgi:hypothetical protein